MRLRYRLDGHFTTMATNIYNGYIKGGKFFFGVIGQIISDASLEPDDLAETIHDLTNWSCWAGDIDNLETIKRDGIQKNGVTYYPNENDRGFTNDDTMFLIDGKWWVCEFVGWVQFDSFIDAMTHLIKNADWIGDKLDKLK